MAVLDNLSPDEADRVLDRLDHWYDRTSARPAPVAPVAPVVAAPEPAPPLVPPTPVGTRTQLRRLLASRRH